MIDIIDSGIGMSSQQIKRIALPFYSTTEKGTGLGTMIAYSIIKELNGDIEIESALGKGTRFSISILANVITIFCLVNYINEF